MSDNPINAYWAAECLLRHRTLPSSVANALLLSLPPLNANPNLNPTRNGDETGELNHHSAASSSLHRILLLRHLSSSKSISLQTLNTIELLHSLNPNPNFSSMYLSVALYLTITSKDFPTAVNILFKKRIGDILKSPLAHGLASETMKEVKEEMERAIEDLELRERIFERLNLDVVREQIRVFVEREWEEILRNKCFVEIAADVAVGVQDAEVAWIEAVEREKPRLLQMDEARKQSTPTGDDTGEETGENNQLIQYTNNNDKGKTVISTPEVDKISNALKSSMAELQEAVKDPLPEAVKIACQAQMEAPVNDKGKMVISTFGEGTSNGVTQRSLMDRKPTACTYEWDDSIESDSDNSRVKIKKTRLPSPKTRAAISPLKLMQNKKIAQRRKAKKWSVLEENTLRKAVKEHGKGNWKAILNSYPNIFEERSDVDLKDKWRNMTRG